MADPLTIRGWPHLYDLLAEIKLLRVEVDRLHQRWDMEDAKNEELANQTLQPMTEEEVRLAQSEQLRIWEGVKVRMREDMIQLHEMDRQIRAGAGLKS